MAEGTDITFRESLWGMLSKDLKKGAQELWGHIFTGFWGVTARSHVTILFEE